MKQRDWKAVIAVLSGMIFVFALIGGGAIGFFVLVSRLMEERRVDGEVAWHEKAARQAEEQQKRNARIRAYALYDGYTIVPFTKDTRLDLYERDDFAAVEEKLEKMFSEVSDPLAAHYYSHFLAKLTRFDHDDDPLAMIASLDRWVSAYPNSYRARLVRGMMHIRYGDYFRGEGYWNTVSASSRSSFSEQLDLAHADLTAAYTMFDQDPEIPGSLATIARKRGENRDKIAALYGEAMAINPLSMTAHMGRMYTALPQWGGTWSEVDAIISECESKSLEFPLLLIVKREAMKAMGGRGFAHQEALRSDSTLREWAEPYLLQLAINPDDGRLKTNAAYFAAEGGDFALAERLFRELGETYYDETNFRDILEYNSFRGNSYANVAYEMDDGPERQQRVQEALSIAPYHYYTNHLYGTELLGRGELEKAKYHFEVSRDSWPGFVWSTYRLGEIAEQQGDRAEALRLANEVLKLGPNEQQRARATEMIARNR